MIQPSVTKVLPNEPQPKTCKKRPYSLPKTQPTKGPSSHKTFRNDNDCVQTSSEIEVSEFRGVDRKMYTHRMNIDFGHLEIPSWMHSSLSKEMNLNNELKEASRISTCQEYLEGEQNMRIEETDKRELKKEKKYKSLIKLMKQIQGDDHIESENCEESLNPKAKITLTQNHHLLSTEKQSSSHVIELKSLPIETNQKTPISSNYSSTSKTSTEIIEVHKKMQTNKLKKVVAAKGQQLTELINVLEVPEATKRYEEVSEREKTTRRAPHCRIVRSYVGGSRMQMKIINYPDSSEYMKVCGYWK